MQQSFSSFVLLFAEPMSAQERAAANFIFSPLVGGAIQDPNSHPIEDGTCTASDGTTITDKTVITF